MEKKIKLIITVVIILYVLFLFKNHFERKTTRVSEIKNQTISQKSAIQQKKTVMLSIDDGQKVATYSARADTPFEALDIVANQYAIPLQTKQYDFGVFVQKIGDKVSGSDMSWIYFVNGQSGTVAADRKTLSEGDRVSWRYVKPSAE